MSACPFVKFVSQNLHWGHVWRLPWPGEEVCVALITSYRQSAWQGVLSCWKMRRFMEMNGCTEWTVSCTCQIPFDCLLSSLCPWCVSHPNHNTTSTNLLLSCTLISAYHSSCHLHTLIPSLWFITEDNILPQNMVPK